MSENEKKEPHVVSKYYFGTDTKDDGKNEWFNILCNGKKTRYVISKKTMEIKNKLTDSFISMHIDNRRGYHYVNMTVGKSMVRTGLHRIICAIFIPIPDKYKKEGLSQIHLMPNHLDGNPRHNTLDNLEWATPKRNTIHAYESGLAKASMGENSYMSKITEKQCIEICELLQENKLSFKQIANKIGCSTKTVIHIKAGESWKHISKNYTFPKNEKLKPYSTPEETIHKICKLLEEKKYTDKAIADMFGKNKEYVRDIRNHKRRNDISKNYNF